MNTKLLIHRLWELQDKWDQHTQPGYNCIGLYSFRNIDDMEELRQVVQIQDEMKEIRKQIRSSVGLFKYMYFLLAPIKFYYSLYE